MKKLSDFTIISDVDGTLLGGDGVIPQRNFEALERFTKAGGKFGIATGRSREFMRETAELLPVNAPCVLYNGGVLYDFVNDKFLKKDMLPMGSIHYVKDIQSEMPTANMMVITGDKYFKVTDEYVFGAIRTSADKLVGQISIDKLEEPWYKVLFQIDPDLYDDFFALVARKNYPGVRFVATNSILMEMLPENASKGSALESLIRDGYVERENLVAIGDFYNDKEMIEVAGIGVTLCDSPKDLQELADVVVGPCAGGAVADLVEYLENLVAEQIRG